MKSHLLALGQWDHGQFQIQLPVPPSANKWWRRHGRTMHLSDEARTYKAAVGAKVRFALGRGIAFPKPQAVTVRLDWYRGRKTGDLDKRLGVVLDALQGTVYDSDAQIVELHAYRWDIPSVAWPQGHVRLTVARAQEQL